MVKFISCALYLVTLCIPSLSLAAGLPERHYELGRKAQVLQPWDISPSPALAALAH